MIYQPPAGARDLLPLEVVQKAWINDLVQKVFQQFGYQRIVTSTLEWLDTLTAGGAIQPDMVIQLKDSYEGVLGLRPELTASIARAAVTRMAGNIYPQRLCYRANVFRTPPKSHYGSQIEHYQAGVELLFAGGIIADAEMIFLLAQCLDTLGIPDWQILLGEAELTRSLLAIFPEDIVKQVRSCLADLDFVTLDSLNLEPELRERALFIATLRGSPKEVLAKVATLDLDSSAREIVDNLNALIDLIELGSSTPIKITLDLSLLKTFDYYTGIVFEAISLSQNQSFLLGQGGRYDQLLKLYDPQNKPAPGVGFSLNIEEIYTSLLSTRQLPQHPPEIDCLVVPLSQEARIAAFKYANKLRQDEPNTRVEMDLGDRDQKLVRDYASHCRIKNIVWVGNDGAIKQEPLP